MQIVEYTEAVDLTMHGMHDDIYVMHPGCHQQYDHAGCARGRRGWCCVCGHETAAGQGGREAEERAGAKSRGKTNAPPKRPAGQGRKRKLDTGKMMALRNAGWSYEKIADEMGCSAGTVWNYFNKDKEDKKDVSENQ